VSVDDFVEGWNEFAIRVGLAKVTTLTDERKRKLRARLREHPNIEFWKRVFTNIGSSDFLLGRLPSNGHPRWRCDFDYLISNATVPVKIYEREDGTNAAKPEAPPSATAEDYERYMEREPEFDPHPPRRPSLPLLPDDLRMRWKQLAGDKGLDFVDELTPKQEALCRDRLAEQSDDAHWAGVFRELMKTGAVRLRGRSFDWLIECEWNDERVFELYGELASGKERMSATKLSAR
jgi:hypothetical protein